MKLLVAIFSVLATGCAASKPASVPFVSSSDPKASYSFARAGVVTQEFPIKGGLFVTGITVVPSHPKVN